MPQSIARLPDYPITRLPVVAALIVMAAIVAALARGLPTHTFYAGDPGVKTIATRNVLAQPTRPLEIPLPQIAGEAATFVDPFFIVHGDHSHAVAPEVFPLLSAPFLALFGQAGLYVLPAAGLLLTLAATVWLAVLLDPRRSPIANVLTAFLGTPLLFYGLEFWEHAPAAGVATLAAALFVRNSGGESRWKVFAAGGLFGVAALLRPEALWFAVAVLACSPLLRSRPRWSTIVMAAAGLVAALVPSVLYTLIHFGHPIPPHLAGNPGLLSADWAAIRRANFTTWFLSNGKNNFWRVSPAILLAFVWRPSRSGAAARRGRPFLLTVALLTLALAMLTAPNDGGAQWAPRYLLLAYVPLAILATDSVSYLVRLLWTARRAPGRVGIAGMGRILTQRLFIAATAIAVLTLVIGSIWLQRSAYRELRGSKLTYARMVGFVEAHTAPGGYVVTDLWWLDQVAASLATTRQFLVVSNLEAAAAAMNRLNAAGEAAVTLVRSPVDSLGTIDDWLRGTCYALADQRGDGEGLIAIQLARSCNR
jgi:hypothetical protein